MMRRMWINQPSDLQADYKRHGQNVLADVSGDEEYVTVYFTSGPVVSSRMSKRSLSPGWVDVVIEMKAVAFKNDTYRLHRMQVSSNGTVRVWDRKAKFFTIDHALSGQDIVRAMNMGGV